MTHFATDRLTVAATMSVAGALIAVLVGMPEVALFVAPWLVLCALGLTRQRNVYVNAHVTPAEERLIVGDPVDVTVMLSANEDLRLELVPLPTSGLGARERAELPGIIDVVSPGSAAEVSFVIETADWGTLDVGPMSIEATAPFGLFKMRGSIERPAIVRVHPTPHELGALLTPWNVRRVSGTHRSSESAQGVEYADLREFAAGDSVRDINWRASARSPELWVSQRHPDRATDVIMLVDSFVETDHDITRVFGMIVEAAVALAESHLGATDRVGLIEFGGLLRWVSPGTGLVQLQRLTDALLATGLYANAADKELPILSPRALPPRSFVVAFTPLLDERFVDAIFTARRRGHDVAVIECAAIDETQTAGAAADPDRGDDLVLQLWHAERTMLRDRLAEQGIAVARWDGTDHIDVALGELRRRRRRSVRVNQR